MPTPWIPQVRQRKKLSVYSTPTASTHYGKPIHDAVEWFNRQQLGVYLEAVSSEVSAHVIISAKDGQVTEEDILQKDTVGGLTVKPGSDEYPNLTSKAWIYAPPTPLVYTQVRRATGDFLMTRRPTGYGVKLVIIAHELLHAAGLEDEDHTSPSHPDVFTGNGNWVPEDGGLPDKDRLKISGQPGVTCLMPPLVVHQHTRAMLKSVW